MSCERPAGDGYQYHRLLPIQLQRQRALTQVQLLSKHVEEALHNGGYYGPMAIAGGYVRDLALNKTPKDLDVFLESGWIKERDLSVKALAEEICKLVAGAYVKNVIPCYGSWSSDIDLVVRVEVEPPEGQQEGWLQQCPIPTAMDIVVLRRDALVEKTNYNPSALNSSPAQEDFLKAVCRRVDLRLNAIGVTPLCQHYNGHWDKDVQAQRLVINYERRHDKQERIDKRVRRLSDSDRGKFAGWVPLYEGPDGDLSVVACEEELLGDE